MSIQIWIEVINIGVLTITAVIIAWYTWETHKLRREMVRQNEIHLRPYVVLFFSTHREGYKLELKNIGSSTATNIQIESFTLQFNDPLGEWMGPLQFEFGTIDWLSAGSSVEVEVRCNGRRETFWISTLAPQRTPVQWTLRVLFDDVEGGRYLLEFDVMPPEVPDSTNVKVRPIRRVASDFAFEQIKQQL